MENTYKRALKLDLPEKQSTFLWGARKTGKSTYLRKKFPNSAYFDLLKSDIFLKFAKNPSLLREEITALNDEQHQLPIIIDEVQKVPQLLDEVHWMIENLDVSFVLCGSSARKLKRGNANMLGGRAWGYHFYPLTSHEIPEIDLLTAFNRGLLPSHYNSSHYKKSIKSYIENYLLEEIKAEGLVRDLPAFAKFLDAVGYSHGGLINYTNIAQDCGVDTKTAKEYYQILEDTLIGNFLYQYKDRNKRSDLISTPKFYLFDVGIANGLMKRRVSALRGEEAGHAFEHFICMELFAYRGLNDLDSDISFWRTSSGLEVDFILGKAKLAIEVKINPNVRLADLRGLVEFIKDYPDSEAIVVSTCDASRVVTTKSGHSITIHPWRKFLKLLWEGQYHIDDWG